MSFVLETPAGFQKRIAERFKGARLGLNLTRNTLAERSGVAAETIKRFESTGEVLIALVESGGRLRTNPGA